MQRQRFAALDGWRGICALLVCLHHFQGASHFYPMPFVRNGFLFVDFFFVLSGFVITHSWGDRIVSPAAAAGFALRRFARLWPLHAAVLAAFVGLEAAKAAMMAGWGIAADHPPFSGATAVPAIATNLLLVHALGLHPIATWNFPSWSISTEFWTYLVFAGLCLAGRSALASAAVALAGAAVVAWNSPEYIHTIADFGFFRCLYGFFTGLLVYRLYRATCHLGLPAAGVLEAVAAVGAVAFVATAGKAAPSMLAPLVFGAVVYVFAFEGGALSRLLLGGAGQSLGAWSYSIYLVHSLLLAVLGRLVGVAEKLGGVVLTAPYVINGQPARLLTLGSPWAADLVALAYLAAVVATAAAAFRLIEMPGQRLVLARLSWRVTATPP